MGYIVTCIIGYIITCINWIHYYPMDVLMGYNIMRINISSNLTEDSVT